MIIALTNLILMIAYFSTGSPIFGSALFIYSTLTLIYLFMEVDK
jgi:hypothetical protein